MRKLFIIIAIISIFAFIIYYIFSNFNLFFITKFVGATEYSPGDNGKVFIQLLRNGIYPIENASCFLTVYYPNNTYFLNNVKMNYFREGLYYYDFIAPNILGVYMTTIYCIMPTTIKKYYPLYYAAINGSASGELSYAFESDNYYLTLSSKPFAPPSHVVDFNFQFENVTAKKIEIFFKGVMVDSASDTAIKDGIIEFRIFNYCNNTWQILPNKGTYYTVYISNVIDFSSCYNPVLIKIYANHTSSFDIYLDELTVRSIDFEPQYINEIRGGGEIHVKIAKAEIVPESEPPKITILT